MQMWCPWDWASGSGSKGREKWIRPGPGEQVKKGSREQPNGDKQTGQGWVSLSQGPRQDERKVCSGANNLSVGHTGGKMREAKRGRERPWRFEWSIWTCSKRGRGAIMDSWERKEQDKYGVLRGLLRLWCTEQTRRTGHQKDELTGYCGNCWGFKEPIINTVFFPFAAWK